MEYKIVKESVEMYSPGLSNYVAEDEAPVRETQEDRVKENVETYISRGMEKLLSEFEFYKNVPFKFKGLCDKHIDRLGAILPKALERCEYSYLMTEEYLNICRQLGFDEIDSPELLELCLDYMSNFDSVDDFVPYVSLLKGIKYEELIEALRVWTSVNTYETVNPPIVKIDYSRIGMTCKLSKNTGKLRDANSLYNYAMYLRAVCGDALPLETLRIAFYKGDYSCITQLSVLEILLAGGVTVSLDVLLSREELAKKISSIEPDCAMLPVDEFSAHFYTMENERDFYTNLGLTKEELINTVVTLVEHERPGKVKRGTIASRHLSYLNNIIC